jgi:glycosyltransferase involved in cell wall biosynthesis
MIYYIAHWDWILVQSRAEVVKSLQHNYKIEGITPLEDNKHLLKEYSQLHDWKINRKKLLDIEGLIDLRKKLTKFKQNDLIHLFTLKTLILYLLSALLLRKQFSVISSITGLGYLFSNTKLSKMLRLIIRPLVITKINSCVDVLIFQNETDKDTFIEFSKYKNQIILIEGSGLNTTKLQTKHTFNKKIKVIFVGRLLKEKGILEFLKIAKAFQHDNKIEFFVAGNLDEGNKSSINNKEFKELKEKVTYLGNIDVPNELFRYDVLINPSHHEGFSRVILEAAYVGLYCIANDIPGTRGILNNLECGTVVKNNNIDTYIELLRNLDKNIEKLNIKEVRDEIIYKYSTNAIAKKFSKIYSELC